MFLKIIAAYNIIIYLAGGYVCAVNLPSLADSKEVFNFILYIIFARFCAFMIFINVKLFSKTNESLKLRIISIIRWVAFAQIFEISIFGASYFVVMGSELVGYFNDSSIPLFWLKAILFNYKIILNYIPDNTIYIGLNFIPLLIFVVLNNVIQKIKKAKEDQFVKTYLQS